MLIPVFFVIDGWGARPATAWRYFIYNFAGGLALLLATAAFGVIYGIDRRDRALRRRTSSALGHLGFSPALRFAFLVKTPVWPLHTWMPPTYADLPAPDGRGRLGRAVEGRPVRTSSPSRWPCCPTICTNTPAFCIVLGADLAGLRRARRAGAKRCQAHRRVLVALAPRPDRRSRSPSAIRSRCKARSSTWSRTACSRRRCSCSSATSKSARGRDRCCGSAGSARPIRDSPARCASRLSRRWDCPAWPGSSARLVMLTGVYQAGYVWPAIVGLVAIVLAAAYMLAALPGHHERARSPRPAGPPDLTWLEGLAVAPLARRALLVGVAAARNFDRLLRWSPDDRCFPLRRPIGRRSCRSAWSPLPRSSCSSSI